MTSGFIFVDKPVDWTSHDVVAYVRGIVRMAAQQEGLSPKEAKRIRVGHAGTLDPFATGLLIVGIGREATKRIDEFKGMSKIYEATCTLGATSDTQDLTGIITPISSVIPKKNTIREVISGFVGKQEQIPPMFSAKKVQGKKLYELARAGQEIERKPHLITIHALEIREIVDKTIKMRVICSAGTYIRTLCHDIGQRLETGGYCSALRRTQIGDYSVAEALPPDEYTQETMFTGLKKI